VAAAPQIYRQKREPENCHRSQHGASEGTIRQIFEPPNTRHQDANVFPGDQHKEEISKQAPGKVNEQVVIVD
jgi:hypothetical protein